MNLLAISPRTRLLGITLAMVAMFAFIVACGDSDEDAEPTAAAGATQAPALTGRIDIEGSSTVQPFTLELIDAFKSKHREVTINPPSGLGSGAGITAYINGQVQIAQSSRAINANETEQAKAKGLNTYETKLFDDALAIVIHPSSTVSELTVEQVAKIYAGQIRNWSEVGGAPGEIRLYSRNEESGTFAYMEEDVIKRVLGSSAQYSSDINKQANAPAGLTAVSTDRSGIFYAGLGNLAEIPSGAVKVVKISGGAGKPAAEPSLASVKDGSYPISRGLFYYTNGDPKASTNAALKAFIEMALSPTGQKIGSDLGFLPVGPIQ